MSRKDFTTLYHGELLGGGEICPHLGLFYTYLYKGSLRLFYLEYEKDLSTVWKMEQQDETFLKRLQND